MKRIVFVAIAAVLATLVGVAPAQAQACPPASVGGPTVADMTVRGTTVPIKRITYRNGGPLDPPHTNRAAGISARNAPLHAKRGATVITWHVRYGEGCEGTLNSLTTMPLGNTFTIRDLGKPAKTYTLASRTTVPKGVVKRSWFRRGGPHHLVLITCADLRDGVFRKTMAIIATPAAGQPTPSPSAPLHRLPSVLTAL
ncbi:MAG: hypothetical protein IPO93_17240 [Actinobacteria bacterium]|nr:hypothetical protein [Actinomycetota bacterium]